MVNNYEQVVYEDPRISLNKLGEYLTTTKAARRERILRDAKFPPTFQVIRYDPTREIIQRYLAGKIVGTKALAAAIADYATTTTKDDFEARMKRSNLEALGFFAEYAPTLSFGEASVTMGHPAPKRRYISGVGVSVRPELTLRTGGGNAPIRKGGVKLNISKGAVHGKDAAEYVGTVLRAYVDEGDLPGDCDPQMCYALDVFGQRLVASPKATVNRMKDVESACGEIARQWPNITQG
jgi:hypothetical protein